MCLHIEHASDKVFKNNIRRGKSFASRMSKCKERFLKPCSQLYSSQFDYVITFGNLKARTCTPCLKELLVLMLLWLIVKSKENNSVLLRAE